jgi:hypothetical protein
MRLFLYLFAFAMGVCGSGMVAAETLTSKCAITADGASVGCDFRMHVPAVVKRATIKANGNDLADARYTSFEDGDGKAAWFLLVDRSDPARAAAVKRSVALVKDLYSQSNARNIMGIGTFAEDLRVVVSPGDPYANIDTRLQEIKADGVATAFYFTAIKAIDILKKIDADRRALVIVSDGKPEDKAYGHDDVIKYARDAGVVIYGIGLAKNQSETTYLQKVERLATETNGPFVQAVGNDPLPAGFIENFGSYLKNGGRVEAPLNGLNGEISVVPQFVLNNGNSLSAAAANLYVAPPAEPEKPAEPPALIEKIYMTFDPMFTGASSWASQNQAAAWALLALPVVLVLALIAFALMRGKPASRVEAMDPLLGEEEAAPVTISIPVAQSRPETPRNDVLFGHFEIVDGDGRRFDIREQNVTIGRHSENDFQLDGDSVHRHHAVFHISPDNKPVITDLGTANGIVVNGKPVSKAELKTGDVIEFGETRIRFIAA